MEYNLSDRERLYLKLTNKLIEEWKKVMQLDPVWEISADIIEDQNGHKGAVNIGESQYYRAPLLLCEHLFELEEEDFLHEVDNKIVPHELTHLVAVDFFRTALLLAGDNEVLKEELRYRYEQFVVRITKIVSELRNENLRLKYELERSSAGTEE